ncbi:MAG: hypothetical protein AUJ12_07480 [Alphaproteobacteria bacterium CG1_02_46_17]|nr:MAG: hypothetical protein AUJ12_07480 [Alphaproteobacteria bacterium CG1_02_46_17]
MRNALMHGAYLLGFAIMVMSLGGIQDARASILKIQTVKSDKNITAWLVEDPTVPVISMRFSFQGAGAINDPADKQGLSQILSNTLDEGAGDLGSKEFQAELSDHSISLTFSSSRDDFGGSLKTLTKYQDKAFDLLHLALTKPHFEADALRRMKDANLARIRSNMSDPEWLNARLANAVLFNGHPYAQNSGGTLSSLPKITTKDLQDKFSTQLGRDRLLISVSGNISAEELSRRLDEVFGDLPDISTVRQVENVTPPAQAEVIQHVKEIPQTVIQIAYPGISMKDPDYFAAEIFNYILGGAGFGSRLTETVREQKGLTYGIDSNLSEMDFSSLLSISTSTRTEKVGEVLSLVNAEIDKISQTPISDRELVEAKSYLIGSVPLGLTSTDRIAGMMMGFQIYGLPANYLDIREAGLNKVTQQDVLRVAQRLLDKRHKTTVLTGAKQEIGPVRYVENIPDIQ